MNNIVTIEISDGLYNHIKGIQNINNDFIDILKKTSNNLSTAMNRITILWILTLVVYYLK